MKGFDAYTNVIKSYIGRTTIHFDFVKSKLLETEVQETDNLTSEEKYKE